MSSVNINLYRQLLRELHRIYAKDAPVLSYMKDQFRRHQVTSEKICRGQNEMQHMGATYLSLLQNRRKHEELSAQYKGHGERDLESSAHLVGLRLPKQFEPSGEEPTK
ncbi:protein FMC1 homolog [Haliotis asinina]|uniref:protein FMC1 homolog n=1 Tax=Haliotis asinina TaxID=109174 RepID=UPI003531C156